MENYKDIEALLTPRVEAKASDKLRTKILAVESQKKRHRWWGVAASIAIVFCLSAAAGVWLTSSENAEPSARPEVAATAEALEDEIRLPNTMTFNNQPLVEIGKQMKVIYGIKVVFADKASENLRLYFTLPKGSTVKDFVTIIDDYETLAATLKDNVITIKTQEAKP